MIIIDSERPSDSPFVERIWRSHSEGTAPFLSMIRSNVVEEVRTLKAQQGKNIAIDGSSVLVHSLAEHDLIDEYSLLVYPVALGSGKKLFPLGLRVPLRLIEARPFPSGVVLMRYARA
jgi:dihydrofolate reductase